MSTIYPALSLGETATNRSGVATMASNSATSATRMTSCEACRKGWYTDDERETAIGIVAGLPHGRFLAGYRWTSNDERVYFGEIFDDEDNAARAADGHAEAFAEVEREYSERWSAAQRLQDDIEEETERLRALRLDHSAHVVARKFNDAHERAAHDCREQVADVIATIREKRAELIPYSGML